MTTKVHYYKIYCQTEAGWQYIWSTTIPTVCPNNNTHTVTSNSTQKLKSLSQDTVKVKEENPPTGTTATGGHFGSTVLVVDVPSAITVGVTTNVTKTFPYPISLIDVSFCSIPEMEGDKVEANIGPQTIIGTTTETVAVGITPATTIGIEVTQDVIDIIQVGYFVYLDDGVNFNDTNECVYIDTANKRIKVKSATSSTFSSGTLVKMTIKMLNDYEIGPPQLHSIAMNTIGGSYIAENTVGEIVYFNNESSAKKLYVTLEYFY